MNTIKNQHWLKKTLLILGFILILLIIASSLFFNQFSKKQVPNHSGEINLAVTDDVQVVTDDKGVPHIKATNDSDLFYAQGYVQARERLFQMDLARRQASGSLSELVGSQAIDNDKYFRTLGLRRAAEKSLAIYPKQAKEVLDSFTAGVNAFIQEATDNNNLPLEYALLGAKPENWSQIDSLTIGKYMAFDLGGHWERQAFNYYLMQTFEESKAKELLPSYPKNGSTVIQPGEINIASAFEDVIIPDPFNGSNNWVISGDKTASGKPLLADDPHLGLSTPSIWYEMSLESAEINVAGVIFAGIPGIILGHNEKIAWGVTNTGPDVQQLFIEKQNPDNETEFLFDDNWEKAKVISEPIKVKGGKTIDYEVTETRHGPIISDFSKDTNAEQLFSLKWTALEATTELLAILELNKASNWEEFEQGLEHFLVPAQNFVFMDDTGMIAYKANGKIPIYQDPSDALLPLPGWDKNYELNNYIPFHELPKVINPDKGYIATANNKIVSDDYPYHLSNVWAQPYRFDRITEVLEANDNLTLEDMKDLQMDTINLRAREFIPLFTESIEKDKLSKSAQTALKHLNNWNFDDHVSRHEPLIFDAWLTRIESDLYQDIPKEIDTLFSNKAQTTDALLRMGDQSIWINQQDEFSRFLANTLNQTIEELEKKYGTNQTLWQWGEFHKVAFSHPLASANFITHKLFNRHRPEAVGGSGVTVMAARHTDSGIVNHGASWRFVIDGADFTKGHHIVGPGQSGHFRSKWYSDQFIDWTEGRYHETSLRDVLGDTYLIRPE